MKNRAFNTLCKIACRSAILVLALLWGPGAAWAVPTEVTAIKNSDGIVTAHAIFTVASGDKITWRGTFEGSPAQGHSFWISKVGSDHHGVFIAMRPQNGTHEGVATINQGGTYHISIDSEAMGPGSYTIGFDQPGNGSSNGEPHISTVNDRRYDFQSGGEFVALRSPSGMEIQIRQTPLPALPPAADRYSGLTTGLAFNSAVAARVNDHRVTYQIGPQDETDAPSALELRVDGVPTELRPDGLALGPGGRLSPLPDNGIRIDFPDGTVLVVTSHFWRAARRWYFNFDVFRTPAHQGIMGSIEGRNWLPALPDGSGLGPRPRSAHQRYVDLYQRFADAWRVTDRTSLFDYERGTSTATFTLAGWPGETGRFAVSGQTGPRPLRKAAARRACRGIADRHLRRSCVFDVRVTGERGFASSYQRVERVRRGTTATGLSSEPARGDAAGPATFVASVASLSRSRRGAVAGAVQFVVDGADSGAPVGLGADGRAAWRAPRLNAGEHRIAARYLPAAGSLFLPSESPAMTHMVRQG